MQTVIEFTHRVTSGIALLMVACLAFWCWQATSKGDWARYSATLAAAFLGNEAVLGAALVLLNHVAQDKSAGRVLFLCLHFGNTLLLLATLALTPALLAIASHRVKLIRRPRQLFALGLGLLATMVVGVTGTVAALGDTLFPATSLASSVLRDFTSSTPALLRFRVLHPAVVAVAACYVSWVIVRSSRRRNHFSQPAIALIILLVAQVGIGMLNVLMLAPVWLQLVHLFVGDVFWVVLVLASADLAFERADVRPTCLLPTEV